MQSKLIFAKLISALIINFLAFDVNAAEAEIGSVTVLAEPRLSIPLAELASLYAQQNRVTISNTFGVSQDQEKRIEDGEAADLFITANPQLVQDLKTKGLVDVYSIGRLVSHHDEHYTAAVVAGENMTPARHFLSFLKSPEAQIIFRKNDLSLP